MLLREVEYAKPASVAEALSILAGNEGARALAGGQTLINVMKARAASPDVLVDLNGLDELKGIELGADGTLTIGAMATYSEIVAAAEARARPILGEVCSQIADVQVRNRGTIGGNLCSNDPTNHLPPLMCAVGAEMTILSADGERTVPAADFFLGVYLTAVGPGELLATVTVPAGKQDGFAAVTVGEGERRALHLVQRAGRGSRRGKGPIEGCRFDLRPGDAGRARIFASGEGLTERPRDCPAGLQCAEGAPSPYRAIPTGKGIRTWRRRSTDTSSCKFQPARPILRRRSDPRWVSAA